MNEGVVVIAVSNVIEEITDGIGCEMIKQSYVEIADVGFESYGCPPQFFFYRL